MDELYSLIESNIWINYFNECDQHGKENWIDFESEIARVIKSISKVMKKYHISLYEKEYNFKDKDSYMPNPQYDTILQIIRKCKKNYILDKFTYLEIKNHLLDDLNRLTRALEIYLAWIIDKIEIEKISSDIKFINLSLIKVISFNYTNTYYNIYSKYIQELNIAYIHGKAEINNTIKTNNMVLGIDEYLSKKRKSKNTEFIEFKKYYQRIYKGIGCQYKEWVNKIHEDYEEYQVALEKIMSTKTNQFPKEQIKKLKEHYLNKHNVYIFGHSLDITDKDILRDFILNDNVHTTIFYHSKDELGKKIANLVKVIGQDELIKRTGGNTQTIKFVLQKRMEEVKDILTSENICQMETVK